MTSVGIPYDYNTVFAVQIERSGKLGESMFSYTFSYSDNTNTLVSYSAEQLVPVSGIYYIPNTPFVLTFYDGWDDFKVGDLYTATLKTKSSPRDYTPYLIGIAVFFGIIAFNVIFYLLSLKEKSCDYVIAPYERVILKNKSK